MNIETVKLKRGPRPGTLNMIDVPLIDLIKIFPASASIKVGRKWILAQGYKQDMEIPPLSVALAAEQKKQEAVTPAAELPAPEIVKLNLKAIDPENIFSED